MPKIDFTNKLNEFDKWVSYKATPDTYMVYATDENTIVMRPTKSTPTYDYAIMAFLTPEVTENIAQQLEEKEYFVSRPAKFIWDIDKAENYR